MLKKYFSAGLLLWVPLAITLWVLESLIRWSDVFLIFCRPNSIPKNSSASRSRGSVFF